MSGRVEILIVIDSKHSGSTLSGRRCSDAANLRLKKTGRHARKDDERRQPVEIRHAGADSVARDLGARPLDGIGDRRVGQYAKVVSQVSVFPNVLGIDDEIPSKSLLKASVELVAPAGAQRLR